MARKKKTRVKPELLFLVPDLRKGIEFFSLCVNLEAPPKTMRALRDDLEAKTGESEVSRTSVGDIESVIHLRWEGEKEAHVTVELRPQRTSPYPRISKAATRRIVQQINSGKLTLVHSHIRTFIESKVTADLPAIVSSMGELEFLSAEYRKKPRDPKPDPGTFPRHEAKVRLTREGIGTSVRSQFNSRPKTLDRAIVVAVKSALQLDW